MDENRISMIGVDGKVRWIDQLKVTEFREKGWRVIVNPKETYYPQYDQALNKPKEDEVGTNTQVLDNDNFKDLLGVFVL